jgi:hypothetical protein
MTFEKEGFAMKKCLFDKVKRKPYPLDEFLWVARQAGLSVHKQTQLPDALIGMLIIGVITLSCQGLIDVRLPSGQVIPVTQYLMMVFESGSGKTFLRKLFFEVFEQYSLEEKKKYDLKNIQYDIDTKPWNSILKGLDRGIAKGASQGEPTSDLEYRLMEHMRKKPVKPKLRNPLRSDITTTSIMENVEGDGESILNFMDEGESAYKGDVMQNPGTMNQFWDGQKYISRDRGNRKQIGSKDPRVSNAILTQYVPLEKFLAKSGNLAKDSGHMARYLIGGSCSMKGNRLLQKGELDLSCLSVLNRRIRVLMDRYYSMMESGNVEREILEFTDDAKAIYFTIEQNIESELREGGYMHDINDFASKMTNITARLAASMHYFAGETGKITLDTLQRAYRIVQWHCEEYKLLFSPLFKIPQDQIDAEAVINWAVKKGYGKIGDTIVQKRKLRTNCIRNSSRLNDALEVLMDLGAVQDYPYQVQGQKGPNLLFMASFFSRYYVPVINLQHIPESDMQDRFY